MARFFAPPRYGECQQGDRGSVFIDAKTPARDNPRERPEDESPDKPQGNRCPSQDRRGPGDLFCIAGRISCGDLTHAATVEAHSGKALKQARDGTVDSEKAETRGAKQHRDHFGANDTDYDIE